MESQKIHTVFRSCQQYTKLNTISWCYRYLGVKASYI